MKFKCLVQSQPQKQKLARPDQIIYSIVKQITEDDNIKKKTEGTIMLIQLFFFY